MIIDTQHPEDLGRDERLRILSDEFDIRGVTVYLLDVIPLLEMAWAQHARPGPPEYRLIYEYALRRVAELDNDADGGITINPRRVNALLHRYLKSHNPRGHLCRLRRLAAPLMFDQSDAATNAQQRQRLLDYCLDVGAASVGHYPYEAHERFGAQKKALFREIAQSLDLLAAPSCSAVGAAPQPAAPA